MLLYGLRRHGSCLLMFMGSRRVHHEVARLIDDIILMLMLENYQLGREDSNSEVVGVPGYPRCGLEGGQNCWFIFPWDWGSELLIRFRSD